jgi:hypothetical protein
LKVVPYLIWGSNPKWRQDASFVRDFLSTVDARWTTGVRRIWRHFALNFDQRCPATRVVASWLDARQEQLPELLRKFTRQHRLLDVDLAPTQMATSGLSGREFLADLEQLGISAPLLRSSGLCLSILKAGGDLLLNSSAKFDALTRVRELLADNPEQAIAAARCDDKLRSDALRSLVDGLIMWQQAQGPSANPEPLLTFLLALNGDPRFAPARWHGRVADKSVRTVEGWLSRKTIEAFFRVIDAMKNEKDRMWRTRRRFWMTYLPYIDGAWFIAGPRAETEAVRQDLGRFARFEGTGTLRDHCGLLIRMGSVHVMEMNMDGTAVLWTQGSYGLLGLFEETYNRKNYRDSADDFDVVVLAHRGAWEDKFSKRIAQMGGPLVRGYW